MSQSKVVQEFATKYSQHVFTKRDVLPVAELQDQVNAIKRSITSLRSEAMAKLSEAQDFVSEFERTARSLLREAGDASGTGGERRSVEGPRGQTPRFVGTYERGAQYEPGDWVVNGGSTWACLETTKDAPGTGSKAWMIAARKGKDA